MSQIPQSPLPANLDPGLLAQLAALLAAQNATNAGAGRLAAPLPVAGMFGSQQPGGMPAASAVLIPIKIPIGQGSVKVMLSFGPEFSDPNALMNLLNVLLNSGMPVDVYVPKQQFNGNGGGYGGGGGNRWGNGGGGGGGGYNSGGGNRWGGR